MTGRKKEEEEETDLTVVSGKGQVVIPHPIRERLNIKPKTKLLVYGYGDAIIMKKIEISDAAKDLEKLYDKVDKQVAKYGPLSNKEIDEIVQQNRHNRRRKGRKRRR